MPPIEARKSPRNQTTWGGYHYAWYPTSQMRQMQGDGIVSVHGYSADGERIGTYTVGGPFAGGITYTLRDLSGKVIREVEELNGAWSWRKDYVYRDGQQLASVAPGGVVKHFHLDHLGTVRRITDSSQTVIASHDYWPFGEEATDPYADSERMKFTGHERDLRDPEKTTDDLDYMHARYYSPNLGRFLSVDPSALAQIQNRPQTWNSYAYARGNPILFADGNGKAPAIVVPPVVVAVGVGAGSGFLTDLAYGTAKDYLVTRGKKGGLYGSFKRALKKSWKGAVTGGAQVAVPVVGGAVAAGIIDYTEQRAEGKTASIAGEHAGVVALATAAGGVLTAAGGPGGHAVGAVLAANIAKDALETLGNELPEQVQPPDGSSDSLEDRRKQQEELERPTPEPSEPGS